MDCWLCLQDVLLIFNLFSETTSTGQVTTPGELSSDSAGRWWGAVAEPEPFEDHSAGFREVNMFPNATQNQPVHY